MTDPQPLNVQYAELLARAHEVAAPIGAFYSPVDFLPGSGTWQHLPDPPPTTVTAPSGFPWMQRALTILTTNAQDLTSHLQDGAVQWANLATSLHNAALAYEKVDDNAATAINHDGAASIEPFSLGGGASAQSASTLPPSGSVSESADPVTLGSAPAALSNTESDEFSTVAGRVQMLLQGDQGRSLRAFADQWDNYRQLLTDCRVRFRTFKDWTGAARGKVEDNMGQQRSWCDSIAALCSQVSQQATAIADAHDAAVKAHPTNCGDPDTPVRAETDLQTLGERFEDYWCDPAQRHVNTWSHNTCGSTGWHRDATCHYNDNWTASGGNRCDWEQKANDLNGSKDFENRYKNIQNLSDTAHSNYQTKVSSISTTSAPEPPAAYPISPPQPNPTPVDPVNPDNPHFPVMPQMPQMPMMPPMPDEPDADALNGLTGAPARLTGAGGVKPPSLGGVTPASLGGGGGGIPKMPLAPAAADAEATAPRAAAAGPGGAGPGRGVPSGAMGGMPGGMPMAPGAHGKGDNEGKGKRVQGEDDALYVEDRAWTEGVIGRRRAKDSTDK